MYFIQAPMFIMIGALLCNNTKIFDDVEDGVIGLVGKDDLDAVVVLVDVFDCVTDCVGSIPRFLSR